MRAGDEFTAIDHIGDRMNRENQVRFAVPDHGGNGVGTWIRWPGFPAVVEIEKAQPWAAKDHARNLLPEGGHQAKLGPPFVKEHLVKLGGS